MNAQPNITGLFRPSESKMSNAEINDSGPELLTPTLVEGELRIRDIDLTQRLGFSKPAKIRELIARHRVALCALGELPAVGTTHASNGRTFDAYYLNRKQAIFITAKSETAEATDTTIEIIERFDAFERGAIQVQKPLSREQIMAQALQMADQVMKEQAEQIATLVPKADALDRIATADGSLNITEAAKALQMRRTDLLAYLSTHGWIYRRAGSTTWLGYQNRTNSGDLVHKVRTVLQPDGDERVCEQVRTTAQGLTKLAKLIPGRVRGCVPQPPAFGTAAESGSRRPA
jgi:phage antirepressor YoqD-like protein